MNPQAYKVFYCLPSIPYMPSHDEYANVFSVEDETLTTLPPGFFLWLINIRLGYMVLFLDKGILIEPYTLSLFAYQLGYDQFYIGNLNPKSQRGGNYLDAART